MSGDEPARQALLEALSRYRALDGEEAEMAGRLQRFVEAHPDCLRRSQQAGHVTGSAWIVDRERAHVLLTHHRALNRWLQLGGHGEGESSVLLTALREAREESGLQEITPLSTDIFDLDVHPIPARGAEPAHFHYDVRYLLEADRAWPLVVTAESKELAWVPVEEVPRLNPEASMLRLAAKSRRLFST